MSKLTQAKVGIITRGQRFWVWAEVVPPKEDKRDRVTNQRRGWIGQLMLKLREGDPVELDRKLTKKERGQLRERTGRRGWRLHLGETKSGVTKVQWIGEK